MRAILAVIIGVVMAFVVAGVCSAVTPEQPQWEAVMGLNQGGEKLVPGIFGVTVWALIMAWVLNALDK